MSKVSINNVQPLKQTGGSIHLNAVTNTSTKDQVSDFLKQEASMREILERIEIQTKALLWEYFLDRPGVYNQQAAIEAAQEAGFLDLAIQMIESL